MKKFKLFFVTVLLLNYSCYTDNEVVINIEEPTSKELNNLAIQFTLDGEVIQDHKLEYSDIVPRYKTFTASMNEKNSSIFGVKIKDTTFKFNVKYPENKYIIVAPYFKEGKVYVGYKTQKDKFVFQ